MTVHVLISGFVQNVGFRQFVKSNANKLNVTGWITNLPTEKVEGVFQGSEKNVEELLKKCKKGPFLSHVKELKVTPHDKETHFESFEIIK